MHFVSLTGQGNDLEVTLSTAVMTQASEHRKAARSRDPDLPCPSEPLSPIFDSPLQEGRDPFHRQFWGISLLDPLLPVVHFKS